MASCQRIKDYVLERTAEGKSKREIMRCLKRYAAWGIYRQITIPQAAPTISDLRQMRVALGCSITTAALAVGHWPSKVSLPERGQIRNDGLAITYGQWLLNQRQS